MRGLAIFFATLTLGLLSCSPARSAELSPQAEAMQTYLDRGFDRQRVSLDEIGNEYRELTQQLPKSAQTEYARALVLLHRNQYEQGMQILDKLREETSPAYTPAWQASIWHLLTRREFERAFQQLTTFARLSIDPEQKWTAPNQAAMNIRWIGSLLLALEYQLGGEKTPEQIASLQQEVTQSISDRLRLYYEAGRKSVAEEYQSLQSQLTASLAEAQVEQLEQAKETAKELEEKSKLAEANREKLKLTAEEWKKKLDKELVEFAREIGSAQRDYQLLEQKRASLDRSIELVLKEQTALEFTIQNLPVRQRNSPAILLERNRLIAQYNQYQADYRDTSQQLQQVATLGRQLLQARQALINEYQEATGNLVKEDKKLDKLSKKLIETQQELENDELALKDSADIRKLKLRMKYFNTFVPFDWAAERQTLINSLNHP
ncbi:MAG: hypothetical protein HUJ26_05390 [Planctomycetaceae bacterium]|nr:hypothetical protein [Planctomycetaceae bacterium]